MVDHKFQRTLDFIMEKIEALEKRKQGEELTTDEEDIINQFNGSDFPSDSEL